MSLGLTDFQWIVIIIGAIGITSYLAKCDVQHEIKFRIKWWWNHDFDRWLGNRLEGIEKWDKNMTRKKWFVLLLSIITGVYLPVIVWNYLSNDMTSFYMLTAVYGGMVGWILIIYFKKQKQRVTNEGSKNV
jgi:hypothetical protein